jgi:hypothetical protein
MSVRKQIMPMLDITSTMAPNTGRLSMQFAWARVLSLAVNDRSA